MGTKKITLMEAYMIETLRSNGISNMELLTQLEQGDSSSWERINPNYNYGELISLYQQDKNAFTSILAEGYQVKFITIRGLQGLLELKFKKTVGKDYTLTDEGMKQLKVDKGEFETLKQFLSQNWTITELPLETEDETKEITILNGR
jgi:hypothetical protein